MSGSVLRNSYFQWKQTRRGHSYATTFVFSMAIFITASMYLQCLQREFLSKLGSISTRLEEILGIVCYPRREHSGTLLPMSGGLRDILFTLVAEEPREEHIFSKVSASEERTPQFRRRAKQRSRPVKRGMRL